MKITDLQPKELWEYFYQICQIPHTSYHTELITKYLLNEFEKMGYNPQVDNESNIYVQKSATKGMNSIPSVMLQAHSDMVGAKDEKSNHDFKKDPIKTIVENGWIRADKTTLGADNGIGVAMILAIFADKNLKHGPIEALITANEEPGMVGVKKFDVKKIKSKYLINLDSEDDREICIGCPGSTDVNAEISFKRDIKLRPNSINLLIKFAGAIGGHSGLMIAQKRINAIKEIFHVLTFINVDHDIRLISILKSGIVKNIIPYECGAIINVLKRDVKSIKRIIEIELKSLKQEYELEKSISLSVSTHNTKEMPISKIDSDKIIGLFSSVPNGVATFNWKYGVPETSSNLGLIETQKNKILSKFMVRSAHDQAQKRFSLRIVSLFNSCGGKAIEEGFVHGWLPKDNKLADIYENFYKKIFKTQAKQVLITGGVEPAFILGERPEMYGISIGPLMLDVHSKTERLNIESTQKIYSLLTKFLPSIK